MIYKTDKKDSLLILLFFPFSIFILFSLLLQDSSFYHFLLKIFPLAVLLLLLTDVFFILRYNWHASLFKLKMWNIMTYIHNEMSLVHIHPMKSEKVK